MENKIIYQNITNFLKNRDWKHSGERRNRDIFIPPQNLGFDEKYRLHIYNKFEKKDFKEVMIFILEIIAEIYDENFYELKSIVFGDKQILSLNIKNSNHIDGKPNILFFNIFINKLKELLEEVVNFSVIKKAHFFHKMEEAERYLNYCKFIKNEKGSLISKIELPNREKIKDGNLFEKSITANEINNNLIEIIYFFNKKIISSDDLKLNDAFLLSNKKYISVNVANKLKNLYTGIDLADLEISLKSIEKSRNTFIKNLNKQKINNLNEFSKIIREKIKEISENTFQGKIIELRSKNVESDDNLIVVLGEINKVKSKIAIKLNSKEIKICSDAFKNNKTISVNAVIEKEKKQYKVIKLKKIEVF